jgi:6-phosphofructokinase 2
LISFQAIETKNWTRESFVAVDDNTNSQYRFNFPGTSTYAERKTKLLKLLKVRSEIYRCKRKFMEGLPVDFIRLQK